MVLFVLAACGGDTGGEPSGEIAQTVEITATEYLFGADSATTILPGELVEFRLVNEGNLVHELQILDDKGRLIDRVDQLDPGASGAVAIEFDEPGVYQFVCDVDDHLSRGQRATFRVNEAVDG